MIYVVIDNGQPGDDPVVVGPFETEACAAAWAAGRSDRTVTTLQTVSQFAYGVDNG